MTDYIKLRDYITQNLENTNVPSNGGPVYSTSSAYQWPFYVNNSGHLNFGYGLDITANGLSFSEINLEQAGMPTSDISLLDEYESGIISLGELNSLITPQDWIPVAQQSLDLYYSGTAVPGQNAISSSWHA